MTPITATGKATTMSQPENLSVQQYGVRWPTGSVFSYASRKDAEAALREDGTGFGILVVHEIEPGTPNCTEWREAWIDTAKAIVARNAAAEAGRRRPEGVTDE